MGWPSTRAFSAASRIPWQAGFVEPISDALGDEAAAKTRAARIRRLVMPTYLSFLAAGGAIGAITASGSGVSYAIHVVVGIVVAMFVAVFIVRIVEVGWAVRQVTKRGTEKASDPGLPAKSDEEVHATPEARMEASLHHLESLEATLKDELDRPAIHPPPDEPPKDSPTGSA
jgi:hypothetical protein